MRLNFPLTPMLLAAALACVGCGPPANFAGMYTIAATDGPNDCGFMGWTAGTMSSGTPVTITQATGDPHATMVVGGGAGVYLAVLAGTATIPGTVSGSSADFPATGTAAGNMGACHYFINTDIRANLSGDTLTGTITLTPSTNHDASCGALDTCHNTINFNGTRPPSM